MTDHQPHNPNQEQYFEYPEVNTPTISDILLLLARQLKVILVIPTVLCTITIIHVLFIAAPVYTSTSKIMSYNSGGASQAAGLAAQFGINISTGQSESNWSYLEIIKSRTLSRSILKRKFDTEKFGPKKSLLQILTYGNDKPKVGVDTLTIMAIETLLAMLNVHENRKTAIYTISINASEPGLAAEINKVLIEELDIHRQEYNREKTSETRKFIEERIVDTEKELMKTEETLKNFMDRNRRIENSPTLQLEKQRLSREVTVLTGVFTTLKQQLETTKIKEVKESDYIVVLDPPEVPLMRSAPKKKQRVMLAGLLGIGLGIVIGYIQEYLKSRKNEEKEKIAQAQSLLLNNFIQMYHTLLRFWKSIIPFKLK